MAFTELAQAHGRAHALFARLIEALPPTVPMDLRLVPTAILTEIVENALNQGVRRWRDAAVSDVHVGGVVTTAVGGYPRIPRR